jgi:hypothetical protein
MAAQGSGTGQHGVIATTAQAGSPLTCFGVNQQQTRLYLIHDTNIWELAETANGWPQASVFGGATPGRDSSLISFGVGGIHPHVFYTDRAGQLSDLQPDDLPWGQLSIQVTKGSPLAGLALREQDYRVFYVGADGVLCELVADAGTARHEEILRGARPAPGSKLACTQNSQGLTAVFYVDAADNLLHALHHTSVQVPLKFENEPIKETAPAPGTALTCFTMTGTDDARAYYLDGQGQIIEVQWKKSTSVMTAHPLHYQAMPGSALTCFGVEGKWTRLYYLDDQARVSELAWIRGEHGAPGHWNRTPLGYTAALDSDLTCYGAGGKWTRLYYLDPQHRVNELAFDGTTRKFVHNPL